MRGNRELVASRGQRNGGYGDEGVGGPLGEMLLGGPKIQGKKMPAGFGGMDITESLMGVLKAEARLTGARG